MGLLYRDASNFRPGWMPGNDLTQGPGWLRMDNGTLDENGIIGLRLGSATINENDAAGVPIPLNTSTSSVHSLYTTTIDEVRYRCAGSDRVAYVNGGSVASFPGTTGDIKFGSHQGQILMACGDTKWKSNGTNTHRWGIPAPTRKPSITLLDPRVINISDFNGATEQALWVVKNGTKVSGAGRDGVADGAIQVTSASDGKATIEKRYATPQNFDSFDSGAATGAPEDTIEFLVNINLPETLEFLSISFDCNPNSPNPFEDDYFYAELLGDEPNTVTLTEGQTLASSTPSELDLIEDTTFDDGRRAHYANVAQRARVRRESSATNVSWVKFTVLRGQMERVGSTPGCNWSTIRAVQLTAKFAPATTQQTTIRGISLFDNLQILGGSDRTLTGKFQAYAVWARDYGNYIARSGPGLVSDEFECKNNGVIVTMKAADVADADFQVKEPGGEAWGYIGGGTMKSFFRFGTKSANGATGALGIPCLISEREAIIAGLFLEQDTQEPPDDIVAILGPHFGKTILLTKDQVWISNDDNPDSYSLAQVLDATDPGEVIHCGIKDQGVILVGTSKDWYRLSGSLSILRDGVLDARLEPMAVNNPPISEFVAQDDGTIVYLSSDGLAVLQGTGSTLINWNIDLLIQGYQRHGIQRINVGSEPGRFRGGIFNGRLWLMVCEEPDLLSTNDIYVGDLRNHTWRREVYPRSMQCVYREPDGKILAGDSSGCVWQLVMYNDDGVQIDRFGSASTGRLPIPIAWWGPSDDNRQPIQWKEGFDFRADVCTGITSVGTAILGLTPLTVTLWLDGVVGPSFVVSNDDLIETAQQAIANLSGMRRFKRVQLRFSGSFARLRLQNYAITYRECPPPMLYWDSSFLDFGNNDITWFREIHFKARSRKDLACRVVFDGEERSLPDNGIVTVRPSVESIYRLNIGKQCKGRLPLIIIEPSVAGLGGVQASNDDVLDGFELYWIRVKWDGTGGLTEKTFQIKAGFGG